MITKPTLLVLASTFPRWKGDTEPRFVYDLCIRLTNDFKVVVLAPHSQGAQITETMDGLDIIRYRYAPERFETLAYDGGITAKLKDNKFNYLILPFFLLGQWWALIKILRHHPVKTIHAHWLIPQGLLALVARMTSKNKPAILCTSHGGDLYGLNDPVSKKIKRYVINRVDGITVVSHAMQDEIKRLVPTAKQPTVAPMGTDLENLFTPNKSVKRMSYQLLFVGRLVEKKGLRYLLQAMPDIIKKYPETRLNITGTGPERSSLEVMIGELKLTGYVRFLGRLSHPELVNEYRQATMAVFPFVQAKDGDIEGLGLVMIEAMGCGCPVLASNIPAVRDVIVDGETGCLLKPASSENITESIISLYSDTEKRLKLTTQARQFVVNTFGWKASKNIYLNIINSF